MNEKLTRIVAIWAVPVVLGAVAAIIGDRYLRESVSVQVQRQAGIVPAVRFVPMQVTLPSSGETFPLGKGSEIATAQCLMCHSTGMVLRQPPLTTDEWAIEINKMRNAFGAPIPADQVDALAHYLGVINGRESNGRPSAVDSQAS